MSTNVIMPQMGESVAEGTVVKWFKKPGDHVDRDEPLEHAAVLRPRLRLVALAGDRGDEILDLAAQLGADLGPGEKRLGPP